MAFYGQNRMLQMQAEMERFEQEISGQLARAAVPRMQDPTVSLRFIPHQLHQRPQPQFPTPATYGISTAAAAAADLAKGHGIRQPAHPMVTGRSSGAVIEAAPTKYVNPPITKAPPASTATGQDASASSSALDKSTKFAASVVSTGDIDAKHAAAASSSGLAYTIAGSKPSTSAAALAAKAPKKPKRFIRTGGGQIWEDNSLNEFDPNDFRLFCGDLGNEVSDELLAKAFRKYPSFQKAKVVRDKRTNKTKGFGFISFKDQEDFIRAMREMDGKYVGNRPIKLRKSNWKERNIDLVKKKLKAKQKLGLKL